MSFKNVLHLHLKQLLALWPMAWLSTKWHWWWYKHICNQKRIVTATCIIILYVNFTNNIITNVRYKRFYKMSKLFILHAIIHFDAVQTLQHEDCALTGLVSGMKLRPFFEQHLWVWNLVIVWLLCTKWAWVRRMRRRRSHSWVRLSLWISAGHVGITQNQSLCKWDQ